jgi:hypothetical protein
MKENIKTNKYNKISNIYNINKINNVKKNTKKNTKKNNKKNNKYLLKKVKKTNKKVKGGNINIKDLPLEKIEIAKSNLLKNKLFLDIGVVNLDELINNKNKIIKKYNYVDLERFKNENINIISKYQILDFIFNENKEFLFVYNHGINVKPITAGLKGYHIYVYNIISNQNKQNNQNININFKIIGIVINL